MSDIIRLLPDAVANQIAAGEVIQRPASVVKELIENAIDSGSTKISVIVKDAGKTSIQVIDDGCGMSETDARLAFERHATSKISSANDLFAIKTMGFRGEALASVAAIAHVDLKTKRIDDELGTNIKIHGSEVVSQEQIACKAGTIITIKNLFYNVPARRKFLKTNSTELRHIIEEIQRVALSNPEISFLLVQNDVEIYNLPVSNQKQRIVNILGKNTIQNLINISSETSLVTIKGYIGKPEFARKTPGEQFFFVNKRFMKHPYFYKAVLIAYKNILPQEMYPSYFIFFDIDPANIDINIHPTKTEIKFDDEQAVWKILMATVKEALGKFNIVPSIDFNTEMGIEIPINSKNISVEPPKIPINPDYNPFNSNQIDNRTKFESEPNNNVFHSRMGQELFSEDNNSTNETEIFKNQQTIFFQLKNKYILTSVKSGLMIIHQVRARQRIIYEELLVKMEADQSVSQKLIFPDSIQCTATETAILSQLLSELESLGFVFEYGKKNLFYIHGVPSELLDLNIPEFVRNIISDFIQDEQAIKNKLKEKLVSTMAKHASVNYNKKLNSDEMNHIFNRLFSCKMPNFTPDGKPIITILKEEEIEKMFY